MKKKNIALGFYQEVSTVNAVINKLKQRNFLSFATISHKKDHTFEVHRHLPLSAFLFPFIMVSTGIFLLILKEVSILSFSWLTLSTTLVSLFTLISLYLGWCFSNRIDMATVNRFKESVVTDEILILVEVKQKDVREVLSILRQTKGASPVTFLLRSALYNEKEIEIPSEPLTMELLGQEASKLALLMEKTGTKGNSRQFLKKRLQKSSQRLQFLKKDIADSEFIEQSTTSSAEWFLDNMYVLEGIIEDVKVNLPKKYYDELPKIVEGPFKGLPRIYALATELIKNTAGSLNLENITYFLNTYQIGHPLTIGELWAFPLMLRFKLIEWVEFLTVHIDNRIRESEFANFWGNRLLYAARYEPSRLPFFLEKLSSQSKLLSGHFAERLIDHLFDEEEVLSLVKKWLEELFSVPLDTILHNQHLSETSEQVVFSNSIKSLITLSQLSWSSIFESVSPVDTILNQDPVYQQMDFRTRNNYRKVIEKIGRRSSFKEVEVAQTALELSKEGKKEFQKHIGYYLIDEGLLSLEASLNYKTTFKEGINRQVVKNGSSVYLGGILLLLCVFEKIAFDFFLSGHPSLLESLLFFIVSLVPLSEVSVQVINFFLSRVLSTDLHPKMLFERGIPEEFKTLIVVPTMLTDKNSIQEELERLEIRYLANTDSALRFGLFTDFTDAPKEEMEKDDLLIETVIKGLKELEIKYGKDKFFLFHRKRTWSKSENAWIGFERKRGKLECLNRFLMEEDLSENILYLGQKEALKGIRYVITLDADTQLPKDQARGLIEVISHPLNRPYLNENKTKVERGYTLIQPRVTTDFTQAKGSWFSRIFSEPTVIDPYTQAISNVYQDLTKEGSYHGKGIYDLESFYTILSERFPDEHLLSHDLLEGAYVKVGFVGNVYLFDMYPKDYMSSVKRHLRWLRGDFQIIDWLFPKVPLKNSQKEPNPLSPISRWKVFDNLRRPLLPVSLVLLLFFSWIMFPFPEVWTVFSLIVLLLPCIMLCINKVLSFSFKHIKPFLKELQLLTVRSVVLIALLPFEAFLSLEAIGKVLFRRLISHRNLLQWTTCEYACSDKKMHQHFLIKVGGVSLFSLFVFGAVFFLHPSAEKEAIFFCLLWLIAPFIVAFLDKPLEKDVADSLSEGDQKTLRKIARKTWRYFDDLVGPHTHWLPPDNYQTALNVEVAQRTSATNIGLWFISLLSAYDFKYITLDALTDKVLSTVEELKKMERYEGHFLNWYDTESLNPLYPRYVSTVDSGNLLACFWTLNQGLEELLSAPLIPLHPFRGVQDTYEVFREKNKTFSFEEGMAVFLDAKGGNLSEFINTVKKSLNFFEKRSEEEKKEYWFRQIEEQLKGWDSLISRYFHWVEILDSLSLERLEEIDKEALLWKKRSLAWIPSLKKLADKEISQDLNHLIIKAQKEEMSHEVQVWGKQLEEAVSTSCWFAGEKIGQVEELKKDLETFSKEMNLKFLYNTNRKLFAIGYNVDDKRIDTSYYDLLASEARIASLVGIAKEDVPLEHWWALGRVYSTVSGRKVLLSWSGTMFEYLMPLIFNKQYPDSLLGEACDAAVACQIAYGKKRGIPWGISESAFSAIDSHKIYQYKSFGIPGLGLKRGLENELVVSPYSSALALSVNPMASIENLKKMEGKNHLNLMGEYGYYESIDFTRERNPEGQRGVVIYAYMAHHQGMIFAAINNILNSDPVIKRFHKDPRICGINALLYERIPSSPPIRVTGIRRGAPVKKIESFSQNILTRVIDTPESVTPKINLLSNEKYSLMISNTGGGYSKFEGIDIYRWRSDTTRDNFGSFCYIKDLQSNSIWSNTYQPTETRGIDYSAHFKEDKSEFRRKDYEIETLTEIVVSPEDNAEIRLITLTNHSPETRRLELTSYLELALAPHATDRMHPAFNKLFIETEALPEASALLGFRRLRSPEDKPYWAAHILSTRVPLDQNTLQYETDRARFIGRGRSLKDPKGLHEQLSRTTGTVLDPIFSLRQQLTLEPGKRVQISFVTAIAESRNAVLALVEKYKDIVATDRAIELAWTYAQLELRHLRIHQEEVQLFQKLASRLIYPHLQLRTVEERLRKNTLNQSNLWSLGISGDLPIVVVTSSDASDVDFIKQMLMAHTFWSLRGLKVDLVILNEEESGYLQPVQDQLQSLIQAYSYRNQMNVPGGVFLKSASQISKEELNLLFSVARAVLNASRGALRQQLTSPKVKLKYPADLIPNKKIKEEPSKELPFLELPYFNGLGGYSSDGKEYVIYLGPGNNTPAPWINVIANPQFGFLVSEAGLGTTWYGNSQSNRITPWSNDPLLDPICDVIYIRDEEMGTVWTPTPAPIRELDAYRITHGQGYTKFEHNSHGVEQQLLLFVPVNEEGGLPLRIQKLLLKNTSSRKRRLTVTAYSELVLGGDKEETGPYILTDWDSKNQALLAYNHYNLNFGGCVAFAASNKPITSFSGDRTAFMGRNNSTANPSALKRKSLSGHVGGALDPCFALQVTVELLPAEETEVIFTLGYAQDLTIARDLISKSKEEEAVEKWLTETHSFWDKTLTKIQVEVPDLAVNFSMNRWLVYQNLSCRFWGRTAFYQSSGAYGFRDQLQDVMALVYTLPEKAREHILKAASRQFIEGDVQHWWHPQTGAGIRTRCSDDLLWLPYVTAHYLRITGDATILQETVAFLEGEKLQEGQDEVFQVPVVSKETASLLEHCRRAISKGSTKGPHGLPLIGSCDWNDGMNLVGVGGKGESVWLAWFLIHVLNDFADILNFSGSGDLGGEFREEAKALAEIIEATSWDGEWYRRAYFDDGTPIGSKKNEEASIDSLSQSWSVISGHGNPERSAIALQAAKEHLVKENEKVVLLLTPPFDKTPLNPGYIKGYPPGVRENGGQYTHGATWLAMAYARRGEGNKAAELLKMISGNSHTTTVEENELYKVEPYVIVADIYDLKNQVGRGGWTWYTGAAGWVYRTWLEEILGFTLRGDTLSFKCAIPKEWDQFKIHYRYKSSLYEIIVKNPDHQSSGDCVTTLDGVLLSSAEILLKDDKKTHLVEIILKPLKDLQ